MPYTAEEAHAAVARGAAWLDQKCPDWVDKIDLGMLNLRNPHLCVLGQTAECLIPEDAPRESHWSGYGDVVFHYRWVEKDFSVSGPDWFGFDVSLAGDLTEERAEYEMLTIAWQELIRQRREQVLTQ